MSFNRRIVGLAFLMVCWLGIGMALGQPGDPSGDPDVPITGIEILIAAGSIFGLRKLLRSRTKK